MANVVEEHFLARPTTSKVGTELAKVGTEQVNLSKNPGEFKQKSG